MGYCPWVHKESDMTEQLSMHAYVTFSAVTPDSVFHQSLVEHS